MHLTLSSISISLITWSLFDICICSEFYSFGNQTYVDDRGKSVWRSEFVECRYERPPNNSRQAQLCLPGDTNQDVYCCYTSAVLDKEHLCCSYEQFLLEHRALLQVVHICVWLNLVLFGCIIATTFYLTHHSQRIIEEDREDNLEIVKSWKHSVTDRLTDPTDEEP